MKNENIGKEGISEVEDTIEQRIRKALEGNPDIIVVGIEEINRLTDMEERMIPSIDSSDWIIGNCFVTVKIHIAPKERIYTAEGLNEFMNRLSLLADVKPKFIHEFSQDADTMDFGNLVFEEKIAEEEQIVKRIITLTDKTLSGTKGFQNDRKIINASKKRDLMRDIHVEVYPDENIAKQSIGAESGSTIKYKIPMVELEKHRL